MVAVDFVSIASLLIKARIFLNIQNYIIVGWYTYVLLYVMDASASWFHCTFYLIGWGIGGADDRSEMLNNAHADFPVWSGKVLYWFKKCNLNISCYAFGYSVL